MRNGPTGCVGLQKVNRCHSIGFGHFERRQDEISAASRLAFALNREPVLLEPNAVPGLPAASMPIFAAPASATRRSKPRIGLFFPDLQAEHVRSDLRALALSQDFTIEIVNGGAEKKAWIDTDGYTVPTWHPGELLPRALAARFDGAVFFEQASAWPRLQMIVANLVSRGAVLVDGTADRAWHGQAVEFIAGPSDLHNLPHWMTQAILPNMARIAEDLTGSALSQAIALPPALTALRATTTVPQNPKRRAKRSILFVPTNGVGLGHAKRCSLVADMMRKEVTPRFAAFPSCIGMLNASGFDTMPLVSRAADRATHDNDVVNAVRLSALARQSAVTVFDGGYVFDSVMRAAADNDRPSVWIRRGLWQPSQNNQVALDRQKAFSRIVVPCEAFDELNSPEERGTNIKYVGPIVQQVEPDEAEINRLRDGLALDGRKLVVTMLGGGVAADRRAQINAICAHLSTREDVLHLLVVWPTATTDPGWFQYRNTRVVQSIHASVLIPLADLFVSAIGYNSFHEAIYAKVPTVFVPQMASLMDDQRARGKAAADRELAVLVEPWELLSLTQSIDECLGEPAQALCENLRGINLPEPGAKAAALHILEMVA